MRIIYVTDLHGDKRKYDRLLAAARERGARAVVNGGDMYPKDIPLERQHEFITGFLDGHLAEYERAGVACLCMPGNDDLIAFDGLFDATCRRHEGVLNIAQRKVELGGYEFVGFNWVVDYPFALKDRCRMDAPRYEFGPQLARAVVSEGSWPEFKGLREIEDWFAYARTLPTIEDELARLVKPADTAKAVHVIHMPPSGAVLDVCFGGRAVGSEAVREFLLGTQPLLSLHGHIHESPDVTGVWQARLGRDAGQHLEASTLRGRDAGQHLKVPTLRGRTLAIQPGQMRRLRYVVIDLDRIGTGEGYGAIERIVE